MAGPFTLSPPNYGKVVGRFIVETGDGVDSDVYPDGVVPTGTVTFTPSVTKVLVATGAPDPVTLELLPIVATIDSSGYLSFNGAQGVWLVATDDSRTNPSGFTYTVQYNISYSSTVIDKSTFSISVPSASLTDSSTWTDLTLKTPVASSTGASTVVGPAGPVTDLTMGTVASGPTPSATITGTAPNKVLNLVLPNALAPSGSILTINGLTPDGSGNFILTAQSVQGLLDASNKLLLSLFPDLTGALPSGMVMFVRERSGTYGQRPTSRSDVMVLWFGPDQPAVISSGTAGMLNGVDSWFQTVS
jgi:hypothetical protein